MVLNPQRIRPEQDFRELFDGGANRFAAPLAGGLPPADNAIRRFNADKQPPRRDHERLDPDDPVLGLRRHLMAPAVMPDTMYFWVNSAMTMMGTVTTVAAAISPPQSMLA